jgi:hypothetical protein
LGEEEEIGDESEMGSCCGQPEVENNHGVSPDVGEDLGISLACQKPNLYSIDAKMPAEHCQENVGPGLRKKKVIRQLYKVPTTLLGGAGAARTRLHRIDVNINIKVFMRCLG